MFWDLSPRDIVGDVTSAPQTFSSWDKCMTKTYCKWPAIVGIVVGSLIVISILYCFARCLCCGAECCACCLRCCPCGNRHRSNNQQSRFNDNAYSQMPPTPYSGYQPAPAAMNYQQQPQFATFDVSSNKKINEDSLPAMPSWDTATKRRVEDFSEPPPQPHKDTEDVEMGHLGPQHTRMARGGYNQVPNGPLSPPLNHYNNQSQPHDYMDPRNGAGAGQHAYTSDLGAQRIPNYNTGFNDDHHHDFEDVTPGSPAPTYKTYANSAMVPPHHQQHHNESDHFIASAASPSPIEYSNQQYHHPHEEYQYPSQNQRSYAPSSTTGYEISDYQGASSPYHQHRPSLNSANNRPPSFSNQYHQQQQQQTSPTGQRPPSLLQVGRKPVNGSIREI